MLKEIGSKEAYVEPVAEVLVGLQQVDPHLLPKYVELFESLEKNDREKLQAAIMSKQEETYKKLAGLGETTG